ncbi:MAG: rhomboid family intramembrane serine protease [Terrimonas sp.]|nr:rhomboid family intramembrane serine protease [Terrimonas sp.]
MSTVRFTRPDNFPPVVKNLLIINGLVFVAQLIFLGKNIDLADYGGLYNWRFSSDDLAGLGKIGFKPYQFVTHMFMHASFSHILFNMFGLWMFGRILESRLGSKKFLILYFVAGLGAAFLQEIMGGFGIAIGASGAIMGIFAAFGYLFPNTELMLIFLPIPVKAKYFIPALIALDLFGGIYKAPGDNIAHWAHLGGAIAGFLLVIYWNKTDRNSFY